MTEFFNVLPPDEAAKLFKERVTHTLGSDCVAVINSLGRVLNRSAKSPHNLPSFRRSTMDGYAVKAADTFGASSSLPAFLTIVGEVKMGAMAESTVGTGQGVIIHTGGMLPESCDAVVQVEHTQSIEPVRTDYLPFEIEVFKAVASGQNVLQIGEDVRANSVVLPEGHLVRPQDIGGLLALGITSVQVSKKPRVAIIATGDEIIAPDETPQPGQIRDINSYTIAAQTRKAGGEDVLCGIVKDDHEALLAAASAALSQNDMLVMTAGSSVSTRDMTVQIIDQLGSPGVLLHGVATRPGKPTIIGVANGKPVLGLPGNPVSAMVQFAMFGVPMIYRLQGLHARPRQGMVWARISQNIASETGREDYVPAKLAEQGESLVATPVFGKSNLIYTLVKADGLVKVPLNKGGLAAGDWVEVQLF